LNWAEISVATSHEAAYIVSEIFQNLGAGGVVLEDPDLVNDYIDAGEWEFEDIPRRPETDDVTVKAYLPDDETLTSNLAKLREGLNHMQAVDGMPNGSCTVTWRHVRDEDWADNWKAYFHTTKVGGRIVIKPSWEEYEPQDDEIVLELDPGAAFGTGTHPTTSMCLRELERIVRPGMRVFDVGTGSGVLSIAAAKLGAGDITAMDYDPTAVKSAEENIRRNGEAGRIKTGVSDLLKQFDGRADLVIANIIADIVIRLFDELDAHLAPHGVLLASGIIDERLVDVKNAAEAHGFVIKKTMTEKDWAALLIRREKEA